MELCLSVLSRLGGACLANNLNINACHIMRSRCFMCLQKCLRQGMKLSVFGEPSVLILFLLEKYLKVDVLNEGRQREIINKRTGQVRKQLLWLLVSFPMWPRDPHVLSHLLPAALEKFCHVNCLMSASKKPEKHSCPFEEWPYQVTQYILLRLC